MVNWNINRNYFSYSSYYNNKFKKQRDHSIKAKVVSNGNIEINGEVKSLSRAAQELLHVNYPVQGPIFWIFEDETLDERRKRIEE